MIDKAGKGQKCIDKTQGHVIMEYVIGGHYYKETNLVDVLF